jgi:uncharacterized protein GlcG (DUF336 family)
VGLAIVLGAVGAGPLHAQVTLSAEDVRRVVGQAAAELAAASRPGWIAVTDADGHVLGVFRMSGAADQVVLGQPGTPARSAPPLCTAAEGLGGVSSSPLGLASLAAISKAGSGAFLSSGSRAGWNAFSTRTASFIVQEHTPPAIDFTPGGPLFGVQFSSLICTDAKAGAPLTQSERLPLGLAGDPGGLPLYKDGVLAGGVGVEADGFYGVDHDPASLDEVDDALLEERAALAGARGFETPELIRADRILADGVRLPFVNAAVPEARSAVFPGDFVSTPFNPAGPRAGFASSHFVPAQLGGVDGRLSTDSPISAGSAAGGLSLTAEEVARILAQAAQQGARTRAAIRQPLGSDARVSVAVVDLDGRVLGLFQRAEAPNFGLDVAVQKARTANFFSHSQSGELLRAAGLSAYLRDGVPLDGSVAYSSRAVGFLAQPLFPPGINDTPEGPFSKPIESWSVFNTGLQLDLVCGALESVLVSGVIPARCSALPALANGITIFPGGLPLYKQDQLVGAVGISGDGVDQDDLIASAGSAGFEAPPARRSDQVTIRGVRLPWVKFPRHPEL